MYPAMLDMVIALARVFSPREDDDDALRETTTKEEANGH
jgi:hypothetical protein